MIALTAFLPEVTADLPGVPQPLAINAIRHACRELCRYSLYWRVTLDDIPVHKAIPGYALAAGYTVESPAGTEVVDILAMTHQGLPIGPLSEDQLDEGGCDWRAQTGQRARGFVMQGPASFILVPAPLKSDARGLRNIRVALQPTIDATECADVLGEFIEGIGFGAKQRLAAIPGKPWSVPGEVAYYRGEFEAAKSRARNRAIRSYSRATRRMRVHRVPGMP